jgi:uncharacterized membrane protein YjjB (DUF3815 family)
MNMPLATFLESIWWAGIAAFGFAVLFNVPRRTLLACALSGSFAFAVRILLVEFKLLPFEAATLVAATSVSFLGVAFGRFWRAPALVFIIPGVIPMVPGALAFRTMIDVLVLTADPTTANAAAMTAAAVNGIKMLLITGALAGGVAVPSLLLRRHRPMT